MSTILNRIQSFKILNNLLRLKKNDIKLGRWDYRISQKEENIKVILANSDNCGDLICGNPYLVKEITDNIIDKKSPLNFTIDNNTESLDEMYCCELINLNRCSDCILYKDNFNKN